MKARFETFTVLIAKISRNIRKIKNREMAEYGLRSAHVSCLYYLYLSESLTATDLCERCEEDKATISRALDFLEEKDFILCQSKHAKRYNSPLSLTEKGRTVGKQIVDKINCVLDEICNDLTEEQRLAFYHSLAVISHSLELCVNGISKAKTMKKTDSVG
ncbi:MAG: MarR family transcriptional regulator [Clostridia bacterium]|nr:MarR family transcriptional regulator [Clostridia bacterium]